MTSPTALSPVTIRAKDQLQATDYTPFEGWACPGSPRTVLLRGQIRVQDGQVLEGFPGQFIPRSTR